MREISKSVLKFLIGLTIVFLVSAFLAPWIHTFLPYKFDRILRRLIMIGAFGLVFWLMRVRGQSLSRLGLEWREGSLRILITGLLWGVALVASITLFQLALGARFWQIYQTDLGRWIGLFFKALGAGLLIGALEEFFFRGFFYLTFKDLWNSKGSLIMTNLIYALVHFFPKAKPFVGPQPTFWDSFRIYGSMAPSLFEKPDIFVQVLGLFLFGLLLSFAFLRKRSLFLPIGIHAGCVFALKMNRRFLPEIAEKMGILSGSNHLYDGIAGLTVLAAAALFLGMSLAFASRKKSVREGLSFGLILILFFPALPAHAEKAAPLPKEITYSFFQGLSQAHALRKEESQVFEGRWTGDRLSFEGFPPKMDIFVNESVLVEGKTRRVIWFSALSKYESTLVFFKVPAGKRLRVFYALSDSTFQKGGEIAPVEFEVWMGGKKLFETRISSRGWQERTLDLTLPFLLQRSFRFSFKVRTSGADAKDFVFYGYVE